MKIKIVFLMLLLLLGIQGLSPIFFVSAGSSESLKILVLSTESSIGFLDAYNYFYDVKPASSLDSFVPMNYSVVYVRSSGVPTSDSQRNSLLWAVGNGTGVIEEQLCDYEGASGTHLLGINSTYIGNYQSCTMIYNDTSNFIVEPIASYLNETSMSWGTYSREAYFDEVATPLCSSRTILAYQNESTLGITAPLLVIGEYGAGKVFFMNTLPEPYSNFLQMLFFHRAVAWLSKNQIGVFLGPMPNGYDAAFSWRWDDVPGSECFYDYYYTSGDGSVRGFPHTQEEYDELCAFFEETFSYGLQGSFLVVRHKEWIYENMTSWQPDEIEWIRGLLRDGKVSYELHGTIDGHVHLGEYYDNYADQLEAMYQGCLLLNQTLGEWPLAEMPPGWVYGNNASGCARVCGLHYDLKYHRQPLISGTHYPDLEYYKDSPSLPYNYQYYWGEMVFWDNSGQKSVFEITRTLRQQRIKYAFYMPLCHPMYQIDLGSFYKKATFTWDDMMNITRGVAQVLQTDDGYWWKTDMKEMLDWIYIRNHQAAPNIKSAVYDSGSRKLTVEVESSAVINGLTLMIPNSLNLDVKNYTVDGVSGFFLPETHQDTARVVLPEIDAGTHTIVIFLGSPHLPRLVSTEGWHYPNITEINYQEDVLNISVSGPQRVNLTVYCGSKGKPYSVQGGTILEYNSTLQEVKIYGYAGIVKVSWVASSPINFYVWGVFAAAAAGGGFAYWLYRRKRK